MIDVVRPKTNADQLLEQIGFLIRAFCGAEAGKRSPAIGVTDLSEPSGSGLESFFPARFPENGSPIVGINREVFALLHLGLSDQRFPEAMLMLNVVETVPALDTQAARVRRSIFSLHKENLVVLDVIGKLATHAAVRTDGLHLFIGFNHAHAAGRHERTGRTRLHAFTASNTCGVAHWIVQVEHDLRMGTAKGIADDVIDLFFAAGTDTPSAL